MRSARSPLVRHGAHPARADVSDADHDQRQGENDEEFARHPFGGYLVVDGPGDQERAGTDGP